MEAFVKETIFIEDVNGPVNGSVVTGVFLKISKTVLFEKWAGVYLVVTRSFYRKGNLLGERASSAQF